MSPRWFSYWEPYVKSSRSLWFAKLAFMATKKNSARCPFKGPTVSRGRVQGIARTRVSLARIQRALRWRSPLTPHGYTAHRHHRHAPTVASTRHESRWRPRVSPITSRCCVSNSKSTFTGSRREHPTGRSGEEEEWGWGQPAWWWWWWWWWWCWWCWGVPWPCIRGEQPEPLPRRPAAQPPPHRHQLTNQAAVE